MPVADDIAAVEVLGGHIWLERGQVRYRAPAHAVIRIRPHLERLREHRADVVEVLRKRDIPPVPRGVRLIAWNLKPPPVVVERWSVVTNVALFARRALKQLEFALAGDNCLAGNWSISELIDRLEAVGVVVELQRVRD